MKKRILLIILLFSGLFLTSLMFNKIDISDGVETPKNKILPIEGRWRIEEYKHGRYKSLDDLAAKSYIGKEALFHEDGILLLDTFCSEPSFKMRKVDTADYFFNKYKIDNDELKISQKALEIITINSKDQYFDEVIKINENRIAVYIEDTFFFFEKTGNDVTDKEIKTKSEVERNSISEANIKKDSNLDSGLLLGIKTPIYDESKEVYDWKYKTLWIKSKNKKIEKIYSMEDIFLPRKNGFWLFGIDRENTGDLPNDKIKSEWKKESVGGLQKTPLDQSIKDNDNNSKINPGLKNIMYLGNDYISLEHIYKNGKKEKKLRVYPIDNLKEEKPIYISDIIGKNGDKIFIEGAQNAISKTSEEGLIPDSRNFTLNRKNGYWIMKGRVNYNDSDDENLYKDFDIKAIPPKGLVNYDELKIPWNEIMLKRPDAIDAFSSPNRDIIVILTPGNLIVYPIEKGKIGSTEIARVKINEFDDIVMAEWSIESYVSMWDDEFLKNNVEKIEP